MIENKGENIDFRNPAGFERLYRLYASKIYALCIHKLRSKEEAEEIVQEVFKSVWLRRNRIDLDQPLESYLIRAAQYKIVDHYRSLERKQSLFSKVSAEMNKVRNLTEETVFFEELKTNLLLSFKKLPKQAKEIFLLSRKDGLTNKEVALRMAISEKTVEYHMSKALKALRKDIT